MPESRSLPLSPSGLVLVEGAFRPQLWGDGGHAHAPPVGENVCRGSCAAPNGPAVVGAFASNEGDEAPGRLSS